MRSTTLERPFVCTNLRAGTKFAESHFHHFKTKPFNFICLYCVLTNKGLIACLHDYMFYKFREWISASLCLSLLDVDECAEGLSSCGSHAQCVNLPGSHSCRCQSGFEYGHDSRTCIGNGPRVLSFSHMRTHFNTNWPHRLLVLSSVLFPLVLSLVPDVPVVWLFYGYWLQIGASGNYWLGAESRSHLRINWHH